MQELRWTKSRYCFLGNLSTVHSSSRAATTSKKKEYLSVLIIYLKVRFSLVESLKAAHSRAGFREDAQRTTAIFVGCCFVIIIQSILCSSVLQQACGSSLHWDFNNKHSEESTSRIQRLWEPLENFQFARSCWFPFIDENRLSRFAY